MQDLSTLIQLGGFIIALLIFWGKISERFARLEEQNKWVLNWIQCIQTKMDGDVDYDKFMDKFREANGYNNDVHPCGPMPPFIKQK